MDETKEIAFGGSNNIVGPMIDSSVKQSFTAAYSSLKSVAIHFATYRRANNCTVIVYIAGPLGKKLGKNVINATVLGDNAYHKFKLNANLEVGHSYELVVKTTRSNSTTCITVKCGSKRHTGSSFFVNGAEKEKSELDCIFTYRTLGLEGRPNIKLLVDNFSFQKSYFSIKNRKLSIIILNKDRPDLLKRCLDAIEKHVKYRPLEIVIGDTGSTDPEVFRLYERIQFEKEIVKGLTYDFSKNNNELVFDHTTGFYLLFMNNDIFLREDCVTNAIKYLMNNSMGTVGVRLLMPTGVIDHDGQVFHKKTSIIEPNHVNIGRQPLAAGMKNAFVNGNTGAFMLTRFDLFKQAGGFSTEYKDIYQDCDYAAALSIQGFKHYCVRSTEAVHLGSATRGVNTTRVNADAERAKLIKRWDNSIFYPKPDPMFSFICCCNDFDLYQQMLRSIPEPIRTSCEFIPIHNHDNYFTVTQALNIGRELARGKFLVYVHQDVLFGFGWATIVSKALKQIMNTTGKVGVVGFEGMTNSGGPVGRKYIRRGGTKPVLTVDEFCMVTPHKNLVFNEDLNFHFYGADLCLQAHKRGLKNYVIGSEIKHLSGGGDNILANPEGFKREAEIFWKKWNTMGRIATTTTLFRTNRIQYMICDKVLNRK